MYLNLESLLKIIKITWIKFKLKFSSEPKGISYKGIIYLNKSAIKIMKESD